MRRERFAALDLLRGTAALSVLAFHVVAMVPRAYLAVDFFFLLSGFVLAHAYSARLKSVELLRQFCLARCIRLYPLYCFATLVGAAEIILYATAARSADPNVTVGRAVTTLVPALLFLPTPAKWSVEPSVLFPFVFTAWSLFWELCVNLIYGLVSLLLRPAMIGVLVMLGFIGVAFAGHHYAQASGPAWDRAWTGGVRACFSFFAGVVVFRVRERQAAPATPAWLLAILLVLAFVPAQFGGWMYDVSCMAALFPLLLWFGADATMSGRVRTGATFLGYLSYPIYVLQGPIYLWFAPMSVRLLRVMPDKHILATVIYPVAVVVASWLVARWFDTPIRQWLRMSLIPQVPLPQAQTAP